MGKRKGGVVMMERGEGEKEKEATPTRTLDGGLENLEEWRVAVASAEGEPKGSETTGGWPRTAGAAPGKQQGRADSWAQ